MTATSSQDDCVDDDAVMMMGKREKRRKPGMIYLSSIPPNMNVAKIREYFGQFGEIDRVFLQPTEKKEDKVSTSKNKKTKKSLHYSEGWLEFKSKRKAKKVHLFLNNQPFGGKKKNPYYDMLWNIKYLPRFKWAFLKQRLEYEREVYRQRMGVEISQVRRETDHFIKVSEINEKKKKNKKKIMKEAATKDVSADPSSVPETNEGIVKRKKLTEGTEEESSEKERNNKVKGKVFIFKQKEIEMENLSKSEQRKKKNELFRQKIAEKKKKKQKQKVAKKPDDFITSVFVGRDEDIE